MSKKRRSGREKPPARPPETPAERSPAISAPGDGGEKSPLAKFLWTFALLLIISGYIFLKKADPGGQNAWATAAPACLLAGYLLIIPAIAVSYRERS